MSGPLNSVKSLLISVRRPLTAVSGPLSSVKSLLTTVKRLFISVRSYLIGQFSLPPLRMMFTVLTTSLTSTVPSWLMSAASKTNESPGFSRM